MEYKRYKTVEEQIAYLKETKKIIVDDEDRHWFDDVNYISLINPYKEIFANGKTKEGKHIYPNYVNFKEILKVMEVELSFTDALYRNIRSFERKLKNLVFNELCNIYVSNDDYFCIKYSADIYDFLIEFAKVKDKKLFGEQLNISLSVPPFCPNIFKELTKKGHTYSSY